MKLLYEAQNSIEAHMILNMLEQAGLSGRIDGEYLQGGVGELQAMGIVRVMVEESDYARAREIIDEWDASQPKVLPQKRPSRMAPFIAALGGFGCGIVAMLVYYSTPVTYDGIDYNGDEVLDERWTYVNDLISRSESDRNLDGKTDFINRFDQRGMIDSSVSDEDFDGIFETEIDYEQGNIRTIKSDTTGNGFKDYRMGFEHGVLKVIFFMDKESDKAIKIQHYDDMKLRNAELDTDKDGNMDILIEYDAIEEAIRRSAK